MKNLLKKSLIPTEIIWEKKTFSQLNTDELYDLLKLRIDIFVVEQSCFYPDLDDHDRHPQTQHLFCYQDGVMTAYLRILPKGLTYPDNISIGRVVTASCARGIGLGHELMRVGLVECLKFFPNDTVKISAQEHLEKYYNQHGFERVSEMYLEDDIPHIGMLKIH
ncbi:GNAT family N-acetyltransferase [Colwellia sp. MB02u-10]|jgi:ElaA protein|uniref:GNAT family N-acetyltransferase n=1 Tax=Colwellia sp. MB02u-10 TaxID=2759828 RepID=UPI0015F54625|nr:GNAT family N-acetyltransferase [Colwellia sp. MB02u-10]MBA6340210.1 GNAT family N-acetyltransferase [Colwellia sp. MB02u-10]